jgi:hypothetical protein
MGPLWLPALPGRGRERYNGGHGKDRAPLKSGCARKWPPQNVIWRNYVIYYESAPGFFLSHVPDLIGMVEC